MPSNAFDWHLTADVCVTARSNEDGHEMVTRLYIRYSDPTTGEDGVVSALNQMVGYPLMEKVFPPHPHPAAAMTRTEAQALVDEAMAVLGGRPVERWWVGVAGHRLLDCSDGEQRPAKLIADGDRVIWHFGLRAQDDTLHVIDVRSEDDGVVQLTLTDRENHNRRTDMEIRLNSL